MLNLDNFDLLSPAEAGRMPIFNLIPSLLMQFFHTVINHAA